MAVNSYDNAFGYKQEKIARLGSQASFNVNLGGKRGDALQARLRRLEETSLEKLSQRDKKRAQTDPTFVPRDEDFSTPKEFDYEKNADYYTALGLGEYAPQSDVKKMYRKLSLTFHPDKTADLSREEQEEYAAVFIQLKNAYKTLSHNPTRRQYDYDRDKEKATIEVYGGKSKFKAGFNGFEALQKISGPREKKEPSETVEVRVSCKLEKFMFGGHKVVRRQRTVKTKSGTFAPEAKTYRVHLPAGADDTHSQEFRRQGNQHPARHPDHLKFTVTAKPHKRVDRLGQNLVVRELLDLGEGWCTSPRVTAHVPGVRGQHVVLWGLNPFYRTLCGESGLLHVRIHGEGITPAGSLCFRLRMGLKELAGDAAPANLEHSPEAREFMEHFLLGPPGGFRSGAEHGTGGAADCPAMRGRLDRQSRQEAACELELAPMSASVALHTSPPCSIAFYSSRHRAPQCPQPWQAHPCPMIAISLSAPSCAKRKAGREWDGLQSRLAPLLEATGFMLTRAARHILPRPLPAAAAANHEHSAQDAGGGRPVPWRRLGNEAFARGDFWHAAQLYSHFLLGPPEEAEEADVVARVLSNRALCYARVGDYGASLADARRAAELAPAWAKAWSRVGLASIELGGDPQEAFDACSKAVELDPSMAAADALHTAASRLYGAADADAARVAKEQGNAAVRGRQLGLAVALYTVGLARLPAAAEIGDLADKHGLQRAILWCNRSAAFSRLRLWGAAVDDARRAVSHRPDFTKARSQLGTSLLGSGLHEEAYAEFARACSDKDGRGQQGRKVCLRELLLWRSRPARARFRDRFPADLRRPGGSTRVFAVSDVHFDHWYNEDWAYAIDDGAFQDDVLIVAGDMADTRTAVARGLAALRAKFRRVFYTVGNHEMWVSPSEAAQYPDSIAKLHAIYSTCDEIGIDVFPAPVCEGVFVVPLLSWYSADFDQDDPYPNPRLRYDAHCKWPMDPDMQVWKYMLKLNEAHLGLPYHGTVITFSHFLPRAELPFSTQLPGLAKAVGCEVLDEQVRAAGSKLHVFGHSHVRYAGAHDGVMYVQQPVGYDSEQSTMLGEPRLLLVYDGRSVCAHQYGTDGRRQY